MARTGVLLAIGVTAGIAGIVITLIVESLKDDRCSGLVSGLTVSPLIAGGVILFAATAAWLVERHSDIYGVRKPMRRQVWRILLAAVIAVSVVGLGFALIGAGYAARCAPS